MAAYQCFCTAPVSPPRRAIAVRSAAAHSASRRCRRPSGDAGDIGGGRLQLAVLHPCPAQQQPVAVREDRILRAAPARTARPITLRARTGSPPCSAARVTSAAGLSGMTSVGERLGADGLTEPGHRHRVRAVDRRAAGLRPGCGPRGRSTSAGRRRATCECRRGPRPRRPSRSARPRPAAPTTASGYGPSQANSSAAWPLLPSCIATLAAIAHRRGPLAGVGGAEQAVGQRGGRLRSRRPAPARRPVARRRSPRPRPRPRGRAGQPRPGRRVPRRPLARALGQSGRRAPRVRPAVARDAVDSRGHLDLRAQQRGLDVVVAGGADESEPTARCTVAQEVRAVRRLEQAGGAGPVHQRLGPLDGRIAAPLRRRRGPDPELSEAISRVSRTRFIEAAQPFDEGEERRLGDRRAPTRTGRQPLPPRQKRQPGSRRHDVGTSSVAAGRPDGSASDRATSPPARGPDTMRGRSRSIACASAHAVLGRWSRRSAATTTVDAGSAARSVSRLSSSSVSSARRRR